MRDNTQASELFELCKEVYKRFPEWNDTLAVYEQTAGIPEGKPYIAYPELERKWGLWGTQELKKHTPLYTSDYLLEKLPKTLERPNDAYGALWGKPNLTLLDDGFWEASYRYEDEMNYPDFCYVNEHLTPLKALLKLTIALSEAGELK